MTDPSGGRQAVILVVDDREDNRTTIAEAFERQGYRVLAASGGREAVQLAEEHSPDLVLTDLKMPDMDGLELLKAVRGAPGAPEVILLTAYGTVETAVEALKHGAFNYLTKPVNLKDLRAQATKALEHRRLRTDVARFRRQAEVVTGDAWAKDFIFESASMQRLMEMVRRLANTQSNVLIDGESGVGKEVVAQALHKSGPQIGRASCRERV